MKSVPVARICCPLHEEETPSCVVYEDGSAFCFGACWKQIPRNLVSTDGARKIRAKRPPEDLKKSLERIRSLPVTTIRSLAFPTDADGYYVVWPDGKFYKKRLFHPVRPSDKYRGPEGHSIPLFKARIAGWSTLVLVEGEINALSAAKALRGVDIISTGSAGGFKSLLKLNTELTLILKYHRIIVVGDADKAGGAAVMTLTCALRYLHNHPQVEQVLLRKDLNSLLVEHGVQEIQNEFRSRTGLEV